MKTSSEKEIFDQLQSRFEQLKEERITAEANLKNAKEHLEELRAKAQAMYGTDDLDELRKKLEEMKAENIRLLTEYEAHLDEVESKLKQVEEEYAQAESASDSKTGELAIGGAFASRKE